jgi:hypothetical protein
MLGDVVLGEKFPHLLFDCSWLIALQRAWGVFVSTRRNTSYPPKCRFQIGSCMEPESNVISVELSKRWGGKLEMSHLQIRSSCLLLTPKWLVCGEGGTLTGVLTQSDQSEKTWLWCHSGLTSPGSGSVYR